MLDAATAVKTSVVLFVIEATVPIVTFAVVLIILPTLISVKKSVPTPFIVVEAVDVVIVPVLLVFGQAVATQVPDPTLVITAAFEIAVMVKKPITNNNLANFIGIFVGTRY